MSDGDNQSARFFPEDAFTSVHGPTQPIEPHYHSHIKRVVAATLAFIIGVIGIVITVQYIVPFTIDFSTMVPHTADVYLAGDLAQLESQQNTISNLSSNIPLLTENNLGKTFNGFIHNIGIPPNIQASDFSPWVGPHAAFFASIEGNTTSLVIPEWAFLTVSLNNGNANHFLDGTFAGLVKQGFSQSYSDYDGVHITVLQGKHTYAFALFNDVVVMANSAATIHDIIATQQGHDQSLGSTALYRTAMTDVPQASIITAFVNVQQIEGHLRGFIANLQPSWLEQIVPLLTAHMTALGCALSLQQYGMTIDTWLINDGTSDLSSIWTNQNPLINNAPKATYAFASVTGVQELYFVLSPLILSLGLPKGTSLVGLQDISSSINGNVLVDLFPDQASGIVDGAASVTINDPKLMGDFLSAVGNGISLRIAAPVTKSVVNNIEINSINVPSFNNGSPIELSWAVADNKVVIGTSSQSVSAMFDVKQGDSLNQSPTYSVALSHVTQGNYPLLYVTMSARQQLAPLFFSSGMQQYMNMNIVPLFRNVKSVMVSGHGTPSTLFISTVINVGG